MARDDRDKNFEKALARTLRSKSAETDRPQAMCADPETLAAYQEGSLGLEQMNLWKGHIAGCSRCQQILMHLETTDEILVGSSERVPANILSMKGAGTSERAGSKPRLTAYWRWAAPAGALAAGLFIWIAIREMRLPRVELAKNQGQAVSAPAAVPRFENTPSAKEPAFENARPGEKALTDSRSADRSKQRSSLKLQDKDFAFGEKTALPSPHRDESAARLPEQAPVLAKPDLNERADAETKKSERKIGTSPTPPLSPEAPQPQVANDSLDKTEAVQAQTGAKAKGAVGDTLASRERRQEQQIDGRSLFRQSTALVLANSKGLATISAPNGKSVWRVGSSGLIERSVDTGATWNLQTSGLMTDLIAGSAPSDTVCWIVGKAGTILRTTDGGAHWAKVDPPIREDFTSVFAVNAQQATVSFEHRIFQTMDGGLTWKKLAPE